MDSNNNNNEENFYSNNLDCKRCNQFLEHPYFCVNCNNNFCYDCIKNSKICFKCKKNPTKFEKNITIERLLNNVKPICRFCKCEFKNKKEIMEHKKIHNLCLCKFCGFFETDNNNEFWNHLFNEHKNEILINFGIKE